MTITKNNDHISLAQSKKITQYFEKQNIGKLIDILGQRAQSVEDLYYDLYTKRTLDSAAGSQLDAIGKSLNTTRGGFSDEGYRVRIKAAIIKYRSSGRWEQVVGAFKLLTQADAVQIKENYPAGISVTAIGAALPVASEAEFKAAITQTKAAGISFDVIIITGTPAFVFADDTSSIGAGFGDLNDLNAGGFLARLI